MPDVTIMMGSRSDLETVRACEEILNKLGISCEMTVASAHRSPERVERLVREASDTKVFICAAGMAAHLAGAVAARTVRPVIGIPLAASSLGGQDALFSTAQMPPGVPVATVSLDKAGAKNAAWLAAEILAIADQALRKRIEDERKKMSDDVEKAAAEL